MQHRVGISVAFGFAALTACARRPEPPHASFVPVGDLQGTFGKLITAGNHPTADQNGTGDRLGLFLDRNGTIWGLPLTISPTGSVLACAAPALHDADVTDHYPAAATVVGTTNEPTGWRGGTGKLELVLRGPDGEIYWREVSGARLASGPVCWAKDLPSPQQLGYYRLAPLNSKMP